MGIWGHAETTPTAMMTTNDTNKSDNSTMKLILFKRRDDERSHDKRLQANIYQKDGMMGWYSREEGWTMPLVDALSSVDY